MDDIVHVPVLLAEVLQYLDPKTKEHFLDGTVGQGGHAEAILARIQPDGRLLGVDRDPRNLAVAQKRLAKFGEAVTLVNDSYANAPEQAQAHGFRLFDGILLDLGFSSAHIEDAARGFSFQQDGPLDMRYDPAGELTAEMVVNSWREEELADAFRIYGEERYARQIAKAIVVARRNERFTRTTQLAEFIASLSRRRGKIHPATRVFQALRIVVNDELGELERALPRMVDLLNPGGRLAIISFHSLEDRIIKRFFQAQHGTTLNVLTKHVVPASEAESAENPRARSAKLRVATRI